MIMNCRSHKKAGFGEGQLAIQKLPPFGRNFNIHRRENLISGLVSQMEGTSGGLPTAGL